MFAIMAEDDSDAECLAAIVRKHYNNQSLSIRRKGYDGAGALCSKGKRDILAWKRSGIRKFIVCHDADSHEHMLVEDKILREIVRPANAVADCCIVVPVEEIEAWMIADEAAINAVIPSFKLKVHSNPETIKDPKEWLIKASEAANGKPLYSPKTFNPAVAKRLRLDVVKKKCPSFRRFIECLQKCE